MDKKALVREYKKTCRPMGVYCIRNNVNGKLLVGKGIDGSLSPARLIRTLAERLSGETVGVRRRY